MGNGPARQEDVIFSPEVPLENMYDPDKEYRTEDGALKKQAQRFYIYECNSKGEPIGQIDPKDYEIEWSVEVANKKPFWYDFNNSLDLSVVADNQNLSPTFVKKAIAPGVGAKRRNPNVLNQGERVKGEPDYRKELVNSPDAVSVDHKKKRKVIRGQFPFTKGNKKSLLAASWNADAKQVNLGTAEYDDGTLIYYPADGISAALSPSDLNTDFADNSNWYDDICDGRVTAKIKHKKTKKVHHLSDAHSAAWVASAPPDYAPQIQPLSTMFDLICGAANDEYSSELSLVFPMMYRLYRMQWVNVGDFLAPSFREVMDKLAKDKNFKYIYDKGSTPAERKKAKEVRKAVFDLFRNPAYHYDNEPIIPSKDMTNIDQRTSGLEKLKLPYYPGDGIDYPGSPAQWFAIPPMLYKELERWKDGKFKTSSDFNFKNMNAMGAFFRKRMVAAKKDKAKRPLLMTRAVLDTLYGGGFHPGVELTWPMRHKQMYAENKLRFSVISKYDGYDYGFYGLREVRLNTATPKEQEKIFYKDFGFQMDSEDIKKSMRKGANHWLWKATPGDLTKWMGIPWQSDAGSCQAVFVEKQYPIPSWWAANLPVQVLPEDAYNKLQNPDILLETKHDIYASRLAWLHTADTGFIGYHAEGGYMNGLINMVYKWKDVGVVAGRPLNVKGLPRLVYVSYSSKK